MAVCKLEDLIMLDVLICLSSESDNETSSKRAVGGKTSDFVRGREGIVFRRCGFNSSEEESSVIADGRSTEGRRRMGDEMDPAGLWLADLESNGDE